MPFIYALACQKRFAAQSRSIHRPDRRQLGIRTVHKAPAGA
jgi:hypothetical protein